MEWLDISRAAAGDVRAVLETMPTPAERSEVVGAGVGGDETTAVDLAAETVVIERLDRSGLDFALVSEELGYRAAGDTGAVTVVLDPIDGSINAKRASSLFAVDRRLRARRWRCRCRVRRLRPGRGTAW
jgi:fructose-1,6-bisphosphatase/inositol monophosphatase family enzyme